MSELNSVYFIGIGGIGMSALARYFKQCGAAVSGYDKTQTPLTSSLEQEGIRVFFQEDIQRMPKDVDLVVYTPAIPENHTELLYYKQNGYKVLKRAKVLGEIVNEGCCYGVAGSHGKSTTSAMLAHVFQESQNPCTAFLGAIASNYQSNYIIGNKDCFVVESDEFDRSFLNIRPSHTIITSIDSDHLDIYGSLEEVQNAFNEYANNVRTNGVVVIQENYSQSITLRSDVKKVTYGLQASADYHVQDLRIVEGGYTFHVIGKDFLLKDVFLPMGGQYNVENALAVITLAHIAGVESVVIQQALSNFKGLKRRFEVVVNSPKVVYIDDYAHHPNEIRAFLTAVKEIYPSKSIGVVFQPHLYSRTKDYAEHFAQSLDMADKVLLMDIYPAREQPIDGVSSLLIKNAMSNSNVQLVNHSNVVGKALLLNTDIVLTIGAGDIAKHVHSLANHLKQRGHE